MNRDDIERRLARRFDGELHPEDLERFELELQQSDAQATAWHSYRDAVDALRGRGTAETSPELRAELLAAVDFAERQTHARRWPVAALLLGGAVGAAAASLLFGFMPGLRRDEAVPTVIERTVQVPVEVVRTERVEVPVEVVRTERVEVPIEVPVKVPVEVIVPRGPLFEVDVAPIVAAVDHLASHLADGAERFGRELGQRLARSRGRERPSSEAVDRRPGSRGRLPGDLRAPVVGIAGAQGEVRIRELDGRVRIETSGPISEYVPVLIGQLETASPAVRTAIEDRLASVHARASEDPDLRDQLVAPRPRGPREIASTGNIFRNGRRRPRIVDDSPAERWGAWWHGNARLLGSAAFE